MNKRKIIGIVVVLFGLVMVGGSMGSVETYGVVAPISMSLIVIIGLAMIFWDKIAGGKQGGSGPMNPPSGGQM